MAGFFGRRLLDGRVRAVVFLLLIAQLAFSSYSLYRAYKLPEYAVREVPASSYLQTGELDYRVFLKPNSFYDNATSLGPGRAYFAKITDRINTTFHYEFFGAGVGNVNGTYAVTASVSTDVWEKNFTVVPEKAFSGGGSARFDVAVPVNLSYYNELVNSIGNELGVPAKESSLKLVYNVNAVAQAGGRDVRESFTPVVLIPLGKGVFEVGGDVSLEKNGTVTRTETYPLPEVLVDRDYYTKTSVVLLFLIVVFALLTRSRPSKADVEGKAGEIQKKYGDWLVDAREVPPVLKNQILMPLGSIEAVVKVADELGRPVVHAKKDNRHFYYVYDGLMRYEFQAGDGSKYSVQSVKK